MLAALLGAAAHDLETLSTRGAASRVHVPNLLMPSCPQSHKISHIFDAAFGEALASNAPGIPVEEYQLAMQTAAASLATRWVRACAALH